jgi:hypothetical protein
MRLGLLGCFVGHGCWGVIGKSGWLPLFQVFHVPDSTATFLMPVIGWFDILVGVMGFFMPTRALLIWASFWTLFTALLRPLAGLGMSEFFERAGNYGVPISMLLIYGLPGKGLNWVSPLRIATSFTDAKLVWVERVLRWSLFLLLAGHGGLGYFVQHQNIVHHLSFLGIPADISSVKIFGVLEMGLALIVLLRPRIPGLMIFILIYKIATELMYPISGQFRDSLETIERFGDYVIPVALWTIYYYQGQKLPRTG